MDDLERDGRTEWSGVRSFQARNLMREMRVGDQGFFYHSSTKPPGIVGICEIATEAHPDSTQFLETSDYYDPTSRTERPKWWCVDVRFVRRLPRMLTLEELRGASEIEGMTLLRRGQRLSVQPVSDAEWSAILARAERDPA